MKDRDFRRYCKYSSNVEGRFWAESHKLYLDSIISEDIRYFSELEKREKKKKGIF